MQLYFIILIYLIHNLSYSNILLKNNPTINKKINNIKYYFIQPNQSLYFNDNRYPIIIIFSFFVVLFGAYCINLFGLLFENDFTRKTDHKKPFIFTKIIGLIIFFIGIILIYNQLIPYLLNGKNIPKKTLLWTWIIFIMMAVIILFSAFLNCFNKKNKYFLSYSFLTFISFFWMFPVFIWSIYKDKKSIKNNIQNLMMDSLFNSIIDILFIYLCLLGFNLIYSILYGLYYNNHDEDLIHHEYFSGLISIIFNGIIIIILFKLRDMKFQDYQWSIIIYFFTYIVSEIFFIIKNKNQEINENKLKNYDRNLMNTIFALIVMVFTYGCNLLYTIKKKFINIKKNQKIIKKQENILSLPSTHL